MYNILTNPSLKSKIFFREAVLNRKIFNISAASEMLTSEFDYLLKIAQGNIEATARLLGSRQLLDDTILHKDFERNIIAINELYKDHP